MFFLYSLIIRPLPWSQFDVIVAADDVDFNFPPTWIQKDPLVYLELITEKGCQGGTSIASTAVNTYSLCPWTVQLFEQAHDPCLFPCTAWAKEEHMRKIIVAGLERCSSKPESA